MTATRLDEWLDAVDGGRLDATLAELYGEGQATDQRRRYRSLLARLGEGAGDRECVLVTTPGRTELGGNHTDHNNGVVLAAGVHFDILAAAAPTGDGVIRVRSEGFPETVAVRLDELSPRKGEAGTPAALVRGVAAGFADRGWAVGGFDACVAGEVPLGAGLSSSAAFEVCMGQVLNQLYNGGQRTPLELAVVGRAAENTYFGKPCGLMDQLACAAQGILSIDFADPEAPAVRQVDFDFAATDYRLVVVDTGGSHADLTPEYAAIPVEMERAAKVLGRDKARGLTVARVLDNAARIREEAGDRALLRLVHFIEETDRAVQQAEALDRGDMARYLDLVRQSGDSCWRLNQNCISTTDYLDQPIPVALALTERFLGGDGAWRIQGGGFAGTIQAYVPKERVDAYAAYMEGVFGRGAVMPVRIRRPGFDVLRPGGRT
ncbi:MAG: galactokinase [Desulfovibrionaceae bacterium]|nr:galactokinase [Desulfovibrionaceae bacterium]